MKLYRIQKVNFTSLLAVAFDTFCFDFAQHPSKHPESVEGLSVNSEQPKGIPEFRNSGDTTLISRN